MGTGRAWGPDYCTDLPADTSHRPGDLRAPAAEVASGEVSRQDCQFRFRTYVRAPTCPLSTQTGHAAIAYAKHFPLIAAFSVACVYVPHNGC